MLQAETDRLGQVPSLLFAQLPHQKRVVFTRFPPLQMVDEAVNLERANWVEECGRINAACAAAPPPPVTQPHRLTLSLQIH